MQSCNAVACRQIRPRHSGTQHVNIALIISLSAEEEALAVAFRKHTLLLLDDCRYALQATILHLTRSSLHRLFQRHDISRLPAIGGMTERKKAFKYWPIGYFHIYIAEVRTKEGKFHLFVAIDRTSKFAFAQLREKENRNTAAAFLKDLIAVIPYKNHTVLTDNSIQFCGLPKTTQIRQAGGEHIYSICSADRTRSSIGSQSQITRGRTDGSSE